MNTPHTHVWCELCQAVQPLHLEDLNVDDATGRYSNATDLLCAHCGSLITTLYLPKPKTKAEEALRARS